MSSFHEDFLRRQREEKLKLRVSQRQAAEALQTFRSTTVLSKEDVALKKQKEEDRKQKLEAQQMMASYRVENVQDGLAVQHELKLKKLRQQDRQQQLESQAYLHSVQNNEFTKPPEKTTTGVNPPQSPGPVPPTERMKHDDDDWQAQQGHVKDKAGLFAHETGIVSPETTPGGSLKKPSVSSAGLIPDASSSSTNLRTEFSASLSVRDLAANLDESAAAQEESLLSQPLPPPPQQTLVPPPAPPLAGADDEDEEKNKEDAALLPATTNDELEKDTTEPPPPQEEEKVVVETKEEQETTGADTDAAVPREPTTDAGATEHSATAKPKGDDEPAVEQQETVGVAKEEEKDDDDKAVTEDTTPEPSANNETNEATPSSPPTDAEQEPKPTASVEPEPATGQEEEEDESPKEEEPETGAATAAAVAATTSTTAAAVSSPAPTAASQLQESTPAATTTPGAVSHGTATSTLTPATPLEHEEEERPLTGHATTVRLDVLFSFGLLTSSDQPYLDNYMDAVEQVVQETLRQATVAAETTRSFRNRQPATDLQKLLAAHVRYDARFGPFVQEYSKDATYRDPANRPNVQRILVVAAIPIFLTNGISIKQARQGICAGLQTSMQSGHFIALAKQQQPPSRGGGGGTGTSNRRGMTSQ